jgi:NADPH:quinone reductase-like Zn-dependent oxidoreductase
MRAIVYRRYGGPLELADVPDPKVAQNSVLVRVMAAAVNNADMVLQAGLGDAIMDAWFPVVPGWDVAGVIETIGAGVSEFQPGDEVLGYVRDEILHHGAYAEKVAAPAEAFARKPACLSWPEAAAMPLAVLTAHRALFDVLKVRAGETLLVHGAAGGVGSIATQLAFARGIRVIGHDRPDQLDYLRQIGAEGIAVGASLVEDVHALVPGGADAVLDCVGKGLLASTRAVGNDSVRACGIVEPGPDAKMAFARRDPRVLTEGAALAEAGKLRPRVGLILPFARVDDAQRTLREGRAAGKVVLSFA